MKKYGHVGCAPRACERWTLRSSVTAMPGWRISLQTNGWPLAKGAMSMVAKRVARKTGIERFHWHLLRHTFAVNYLVNGGDAFSLQRILGHTTLEMVRRYMHLADVHVRLQHRRYSPMDVMQAGLRLKVAAR